MDLLSLFITLLYLIALILLFGIFIIMIYALTFGAPYATLAYNRIETMKKLLNLKKGQKLVDLGSGDGRIVIEFARAGIEAHGYEINPVLVALSRFKIRKAGLERKAFIHFKSYWMGDLSQFDAATVYGIAHMMPRLEKKLIKELKPGSKIASNYFKFPNLRVFKEENKVKLYEIS